ncbi:hypothetical protein BCR35DRAFT_299707 [Leucosporidium creatinivorum]|uniref:Pinin/SDK/MemA protein domain-containing protein n=1 Tax=Leucosporidium creatinivorum TaxID=106004 RepID=A0A1Y2G0H9_9BASI|nr:hypothetical protein BCR35DRAFT_299707 [Leucosporidium creatinivorum]
MAEVATASASPPPPPPVAAPMDTETASASPARQASPPPADSPAPEAPAAEAAPTDEATPIAVDGEGSPAPAAAPVEEDKPAEPTAEELEAQALKKRKLAVVADESKKRGRRMFGLLQSTLKQAKTAGENVSGAAQKRRELEERLANKLKDEKEEMERKGRSEREMKELKLQVVKKEEEIGRTEAIYRVRHTTKLQLANFLCTSFTMPPPPPSTDGISVPFAPRLPHGQRVAPGAPKPIYYRPYRLLAAQEDQIEDQIAAVKKAIRKEEEDWKAAKGEKFDELDLAKRKRDEQVEEVERAEREERQKRRREAEEREEKERERRGSGAEMVDRSRAEVVNGADEADVAMATEAVPVDKEEAEANGVDAGKADDKMDGGEEDLEY